MADFTGMTVKMVMKQPPGFSVQGKVSQVIAGQTLTLEDGKLQMETMS